MKPTSARRRLQRGGTLSGFVVGLVVGLGIALAVALYVARVPVPFVDRGISRTPAQEAEEAERLRGWNPNAKLVGPQVPLPTDPQPALLPEPAQPPVVLPDTPDVAEAALAPSQADPIGDLARSRLAAQDSGGASEASPPVEAFTYFVQAGAFRTPEDAEAQRARLGMLGISADITEREQNGRPVFRVRIGPFGQRAVADATLAQLAVNGVEAALVRIQR